jgi:CRP-like cAMP-binding protein
MAETFKEYLRNIHWVEDKILDEYASNWKTIVVPCNTLLTYAGKTERYMYYVQEGIQKSYYLNHGREHVIAFTYPPSFSGIPESFLSQSPSEYFLETLSNSLLLRISYEKHQQMLNKHRAIETLFRKATERVLIGVLQRHYELMAYTIEGRFQAFMKRSPHLLNQVPHKDLASYLRIDPANFSKLLSSVKL